MVPRSYSPRSPVWSPNFPPTELPPVPLSDFSSEKFVEEPDALVCTSDGVDLYAHQSILKLASSELRQKVESAALLPRSGGRVCVPFARTGSAVRTLLKYIYPHTTVNIESFEELLDGLDMAKKYKVDGLREMLRGLMRMEGSCVNLRVDPMRAYGIACTYGLEEEAKLAARLAVGKVDFRKQRSTEAGSSDGMDADSAGVLQELHQKGVSLEHAFLLMQKQLSWECALTDVLLRSSHPDSILFLEKEEALVLVCGDCEAKAAHPQHVIDRYDFPVGLVEWQRIWAERVHSLLLSRPFDECRDLFRPECVVEIWDQGCEECMVRLMRNYDELDDWLSRVWRALNRNWLRIF